MPADLPVGRLLRPTLWLFANDYISFITRPWSPYVTYSSFFLSISLAFVWGCRALCVFDVVAARVWCCLMGHTQARSVFPTAFGSLSASDFRALILRRSTLSSLIAFSILHASESRGIPEPPGLPPQTLEIRMHFSRVQYLTRIAFYIRISH